MYDNPNRIKYAFGNFNFGGAVDETFSIRGPKGKSGRLFDYGVEGVTTVMNGGTITPKVAVGTPALPNSFGAPLDLQAVPDNDYKSVRSTFAEPSTGFTAQMVNRTIPKDTEVYLTCTGATGAPTGVGVPFVIIDWSL
jgi:hypothetical protein